MREGKSSTFDPKKWGKVATGVVSLAVLEMRKVLHGPIFLKGKLHMNDHDWTLQ